MSDEFITRAHSARGRKSRSSGRSRKSRSSGRSRLADLKRLLAMPAPALLAGGLATSLASTFAATRVADGPLSHQTRSFDHNVFGLARRARYPDRKPLDTAMSLVTAAGEPNALYPLASLVAAAWVAQDRTADAATLMLALLGSGGINRALKRTIRRPRPLFKLPLPRSSFSGYSFPSDHATMSIATYGMVAVLLARRMRAGRKGKHDGHRQDSARARRWATAGIWATVLTWCGLIGWSRVYQGVHNPTDVLGGWLAGGTWLLACSLASRTS